MKKLILLFILIPFLSFAKFYKGTVTMNDGSLKNGFIELPDPDDAKIKFRTEEKGDTEKLSIDAVKGFEVSSDKNGTMKFVAVYIATQRSELHIEKKKSWLRIVKEGKINLYSACFSGSSGFMTSSGLSVAGSSSSGGCAYYINRPSDNFVIFIDENYGPGTICGNCFSQMKKTLSRIFEKHCPKLADLIDKKDIKKNGYTRIVELYEENCGK